MSPRNPFLALRSLFFFPSDLVNGYYYWERNEWSRRHAWHPPWDPWFLAHCACLIVVDIGFYGFLAYFLRPPYSLEDKDIVSALPDPTWDVARWSYLIMLFFTIVPKLLIFITGVIDTTDPAVVAANVSRSRTYVKQYGIPVIDSHTGICGICRVKV